MKATGNDFTSFNMENALEIRKHFHFHFLFVSFQRLSFASLKGKGRGKEGRGGRGGRNMRKLHKRLVRERVTRIPTTSKRVDFSY